jgi:hypothetical protein
VANWTGTVAISDSTGTLTSADASTATNSAAAWPTGGTGLANFYIRILTGTGASTTPVLITSNTSTAITITGAWPDGTPDDTSTYEIVCILKNNDHITGNLLFSTGSITELEDSATIYVDGNYYIKFTSATCVIRWAKTESTLATFCKNARATSGTIGSWSYIWPAADFTTPAQIQFIKIQDTIYGLPLTAQDTTGIHHIWIDGLTADSGFNDGAMSASMRLRNFYISGSPVNMTFSCTGNYELCYDTCCFNGIAACTWIVTGSQTQTIENCVFYHSGFVGYIDNVAGQTYRIYDSYFESVMNSQRLIGNASVDADGAYVLRRNTIRNTRSIYNNAACDATCASSFNDLTPTVVRASSYAYTDVAATNFSSLTSNSDYITGQLGALPVNIDTSESTTSTATPKQYKNLTATRTNARSTRNKPLVVDNIAITNITAVSCTVTFDCANGAAAGQGSTTVDADSASGTAELFVASTAGFEVREKVEVGYGTARYELLEILSIDAGNSITFTDNMAYTHEAADADTVKKNLRHSALPYIEIGIETGVYQKGTAIPPQDDFPLFYTGLKSTYDGMSFEFKKVGHTVNLICPLSNTTYYIKCYAYNILNEALLSAETSFTTLAAATPTLAATFVG